MEITVEELNILLQREFERGQSSNQTIIYTPSTNFDFAGYPVSFKKIKKKD